MRLITTAIVGVFLFVIASILAVLEAIHLTELIETHLPEWMHPMINLNAIFILMSVGILMIGLALLEYRGEKKRHKDPAESKPEPLSSPSQVASPQIRQEANPTIDASQKVEIHNYPQPRVSHLIPAPAPPPKSNVQFLGAFMSQFGEGDNFGLDEVPNGHLTGVKAGFRNQYLPGQIVADFEFARAHVIFRNKEGREVCDVPSCTWLGHYPLGVDLEIGHSYWFVLVFYEPRSRTWNSKWTRKGHSEYDWMGGTTYVQEAKPIPDGLITAEITLISDSGISLPPNFVDMRLHSDGQCEILG